MNVLIVGSGAREHALAWRINRSLRLTRLWTAPGNFGTAELGVNLDLDQSDVEAVVSAARSVAADLVVVGPEAPLAAGLAGRSDRRRNPRIRAVPGGRSNRVQQELRA